MSATTPGTAATLSDTPSLPRRLAVMLYEGVVLFGVLMLAGYLYSSLSQQRHALEGRHGLQAFVFLVLGIYFVWFWSHGGQTVAMKAWHVRLVGRHGEPVSQWRALGRYAASWVWFLPALLAVQLAPGHTPLAYLAPALWVLAYAATARLHPQRQFWHDALCGTRLVQAQPTAASGGQNARP